MLLGHRLKYLSLRTRNPQQVNFKKYSVERWITRVKAISVYEGQLYQSTCQQPVLRENKRCPPRTKRNMLLSRLVLHRWFVFYFAGEADVPCRINIAKVSL